MQAIMSQMGRGASGGSLAPCAPSARAVAYRGGLGAERTASSQPARSGKGKHQRLKGRKLRAVETREAPQAPPRMAEPEESTGQSSRPPLSAPAEWDGGDVDVVVIGSGIGGLSCAALLARYGKKVVVCEAHVAPGGAAHTWVRNGYHFDSGTSLFFGLGRPEEGLSDNPLASVLELLEEEIDMVEYGDEGSCIVFPGSRHRVQIGSDLFPAVVEELWGAQAAKEWVAFQDLLDARREAAVTIHPMAVRLDDGVAATTVMRDPLTMARYLLGASTGDAMFSSLIDETVTVPELREFVDLLCQGTSGLPPHELQATYAVRAFGEMYMPDTRLEFPRGGSQQIVDALVRGLEKFGGRLLLGAPVEGVVVEGGRAAGVKLRSGQTIRAGTAVVSNATAWDTRRLLPPLPEGAWDEERRAFHEYVEGIEVNMSFMHIHVAFDGEGLDDLPLHYWMFDDESLITDNGWPTIAIPSAVDPSAAPPGKHVLHAYIAEPWGDWEGMTRGSEAYARKKGERSEVLWRMIERVIPDIRERAEYWQVGSPLTHAHFLKRHRGTYGPKNLLKVSDVPVAVQPMKGMYLTGDSTFPGVGTPAVAASGMWVANTLVPVWSHWRAMDALAV